MGSHGFRRGPGEQGTLCAGEAVHALGADPGRKLHVVISHVISRPVLARGQRTALAPGPHHVERVADVRYDDVPTTQADEDFCFAGNGSHPSCATWWTRYLDRAPVTYAATAPEAMFRA
ncbi:hypothetical protein [Streptomyces sp. NPDC046727]|uniref:hypothetical protein n=1 Tax=Streptomyces sp. NPDC046727 TaxID=3155373 RepID=UPI0033E2A89A